MARDILIRLESPDFDCDDLEVRRLVGQEAISEMFSFEVHVVVPGDAAHDVDTFVGADATIVFQRDQQVLRRVHGLVAKVVDQLQTEHRHVGFVLTIVPAAWRMDLVDVCEALTPGNFDEYPALTVPNIIRRKLDLVNLAEGEEYVLRLHDDYPVRNFVVQYRESDLRFVSRLAEHIGIFFFFEETERGGRIVFADHPTYPELSPDGVVAYQRRGEEEDVYHIEVTRRLIPRLYVARDYLGEPNEQAESVDVDRNPRTILEGMFELPGGDGGGAVDYGSHPHNERAAERVARIRAERRKCEQRVYDGKSALPAFSPGHRFVLDGHPRVSAPLLITRVHHDAVQTVAGYGHADDQRYQNRFEAIEAGLTFRPALKTPVPRIHGVLPGIVEEPGEIGAYAKLDGWGRYLVRLAFDSAHREGDPSRRIRMVQASAGPNYGIHFPLKPGVEVMVAFVDGDPDRPVIVGAAPNELTRSPVIDSVNRRSRIVTESDVLIEIDDGPLRDR